MVLLGELRPTSINGLNSLDIVDTLTASSVIASNLYTKIETDALLANVSSNSDDLDSKQDIITPTTQLSCGPLTVLGSSSAEPTSSLHVVGDGYISTTLNVGGDFTAPNIYNKNDVDSLLSSYAPTIADNSLTISKTSGLNDALLTKASVSSLVAGLSSKQAKIDSFSSLNLSSIDTINANVSGELNAGLTSINVTSTGTNALKTCDIGSSISVCQFSHGHHIDSYNRSNNTGRTLYLNYYANLGVRFGNNNGKIGINCDPSNYQLDCVGAARFSSSVSANNYITTSGQIIKKRSKCIFG